MIDADKAISPKIVVLDGYTLNPGDLSWDKIKALGNTHIYEHSALEQVVERAKEAEVILVNKVLITAAIMRQLPQLKCICVTATGTNNVDLEFAAQQQIQVYNAVGYGSPSVAQHVFALMLAITNKVSEHNQTVQEGKWTQNRDFSYWLHSIPELNGKIMGIYGFGRIGQQVGSIAEAFGMKVIANHKHPKRDARPGVEFVDLPTLFKKSDFISLHAPLNKNNEQIVNKQLLEKMKPHAILINTGRGGLINELDLKTALAHNQIGGAALDVLSKEPPPSNHLLLGVKNCIITPHMAWASIEARQRLMEITIENIKNYLDQKKSQA